ncbi:MAG: hypothetical protein IT324_11095 [Anaerolineae bacterium]|nr:hypothetical protein [Anaerolineae bacterium]
MAQESEERGGCLDVLFRAGLRLILRLFGIGTQEMRRTLEPLDQQYREFVDSWVSERLARWLYQTRYEIDEKIAMRVLLGEADHYPEVARMIRDTLIDAKVTFSQRDGKQYLEIEAYTAPRQTNGTMPQILRWRAEREISWQEIPDDVRERLIRARQPVTLGYAIPQ